MENFRYNYRSVFFRRPIWTSNNILFGKILSVTALLLFLGTAMFATIYRFDRPMKLKPGVREAYLTRLAPKILPEQPIFASNSNEMSSIVTMLPTPEEIAQKNTIVETELASVRPVSQPKQTLRMNAEKTESVNAVEAFVPKNIEEALTRVEPIPRKKPAVATQQTAPEQVTPLNETRQKDREYQKSVRAINVADEKYTVEKSQFTDFNIVTGYRNDEQTLATATENRRRVQHCIDRIYRLYNNVQGYITVQFDVHPGGYAIPESVRIIESTLPNPEIAQCITRSIRNWRNFKSLPIEYGRHTVTQKYVF